MDEMPSQLATKRLEHRTKNIVISGSCREEGRNKSAQLQCTCIAAWSREQLTHPKIESD